MITIIASVQAATCLGLAVAFAAGGQYRLAVAQACYAVATVFLFAR